VSSLCWNGSTKPSLGVFAGELGEMPIQQSLIDPRFDAWIVGVRLDLFNDAT
jgi:hypothetical protein